MLVYQKTMFDCYYCIKSFCHLKTLGKKNASKSYFCITIMAGKKHEASIGFDNACSRATTVILTSLDYVHFYARYR